MKTLFLKACHSVPATWLVLPQERKNSRQDTTVNFVLQCLKLGWKKTVFKETSPFLQKLEQVQTSFLAKQDKDSFLRGKVLAWHQLERILYTVIRSLARLKARDSKAKEESIPRLTYERCWNIFPSPFILKKFLPGLHEFGYENICSRERIPTLQYTT